MKPILLDLFCGAGGCARGYQRAGFYVVGVDTRLQPRYAGDEFHQADALDVLRRLLAGETWQGYVLADFAAIHASPPCQGYLNLAAVNGALGRESDHRLLIGPVRDALLASGLPFVIENVPDAREHLREPIRLCGSSFGLAVRRHRLFECSFPVMAPPCAHHLQSEPRYWTSHRPKGEVRLSKVVQVYGNGGGHGEWPAAMGIDWMTGYEIREAIPPAMTEHIGGYLMAEALARQESAA